MDFRTKLMGSIPPPSSPVGRKISASKSNKSGFKGKNISSSFSPTPMASPFSVASLDAAFLDFSKERGIFQNITHGHTLLGHLEYLKTHILSENLSYDYLIELKNLISNQDHEEIDPNLRSVLKEIKTRIAVELAKLKIDSYP